MRLSYAIVFVSDMARSVAFYRDVLGLPLRFETPEWTEFATEGATLALHASKEVGDLRDENDPTRSVGVPSDDLSPGRCRPGLSVPDLDAFHKQMVEHKVVCLQAPKAVFGVRIAQYADPDGLGVSVSEQRAG